MAVLGSSTKRSIIVAASIEAKRFGVKTATPVAEAKLLCPELIMIEGEPRKYSWVTKQFVRIFDDYSDKVEIFSIDECFLDVTQTAHLYTRKASNELNENCKLKIENSFLPRHPEFISGSSEIPKQVRNDELESFEGAINIAKEIKKRIREEIGSWISCSVGISYNKFLAKTGSDLQKPDGLVLILPNQTSPCRHPEEQFCQNLRREDLDCHIVNSQLTPRNDIKALTVDECLLNLPLSEYCGIGSRLLKRLRMLGIHTTQQLREYPNVLLNKEFGIATGQKLKRMSHGLDNSLVGSWHEQPPAKSFSCSRTLNRDVYKKVEIEKQILFLLEKVSKKMRDEGYWGKEVGLWLRFKDFSGTGKSARIGKWSQDSLEMYSETLKLLKTMNIMSPVRAIGVYIGQVQLAKNVPQSMLEEDKTNEKILAAMDAVNNRFGDDVITRARLAGVKLKEVVSGMGRDKFQK